MRANIRQHFEPLFADTGGIDSWLGVGTPPEVFDRLGRLATEPLSRSQLCQLLILSNEAGPSEGFFNYYWLQTPPHTYETTTHGVPSAGFQSAWLQNATISSLAHLRWGLYRFYVDALLYFGNVRSAYRTLRDKTEDELESFFARGRIDTDSLKKRGPALDLKAIAKDDRYLVAEYAFNSLDCSNGKCELEKILLEAFRAHVNGGASQSPLVAGLINSELTTKEFPGWQKQLMFSAGDILNEEVSREDELESLLRPILTKFEGVRAAALENTKHYLSMVDDLDVYVSTSMRTRAQFEKMQTFCSEVFAHADLDGMHIRYFDPTMSAADGRVDNGLIECLMVDAAKILVYHAGEQESLGKDFEAAMALSRGKPVIVYCDDEQTERLYRDVHPLMRLIQFDTGVAVGAMITNSVHDVGTLIARILTNKMEYWLSKTPDGSLHLSELMTSSIVRLQTHNQLLQEAFWNYYHHRGVLE